MSNDKTRRDQCRHCRQTAALRTNGTIGRHLTRGNVCPGTGKPPKPYHPSDCPTCVAYRANTPHLAEAAASVAIEHGKTADEMLWRLLATYHQLGHRTPNLTEEPSPS